MAKNTKQYISNSLYGGHIGISYETNAPKQFGNQQKQYMAGITHRFIAERAYLSSDYVSADVQGIADDFYEYVTTKVRLADITSTANFLTKRTDDYKEILFSDPKISYIPVGAKIKTMGNTWIVINPSNMASAQTTAVIVRCNTSYNSYNEYGALITEPIYVEKLSMLGNDDFTKQNLVLLEGHFNVICQLNENTEKLGHNQRIMLGSMPYHITGFTDFIQEFSGDRDSVHLLNFTARLEEVTNNDDDTNDFVANGNVEEYAAQIIGGTSSMTQGNTLQLTASLLLNNNKVIPTDENPISWIWSVADDSILSVSENGLVSAIGEGSTIVSCSLKQNNEISACLGIRVTAEADEPYVQFTSFSDTSVSQYDSEIYTAAYFENGEETSEVVQWSFAGASEEDYTAEIDGNSVMISCDSPSDIPLILTATCNGYSVSLSISLEGY